MPAECPRSTPLSKSRDCLPAPPPLPAARSPRRSRRSHRRLNTYSLQKAGTEGVKGKRILVSDDICTYILKFGSQFPWNDRVSFLQTRMMYRSGLWHRAGRTVRVRPAWGPRQRRAAACDAVPPPAAKLVVTPRRSAGRTVLELVKMYLIGLNWGQHSVRIWQSSLDSPCMHKPFYDTVLKISVHLVVWM